MQKEESRLLMEKMIYAQVTMIKWNAKHIGGCYNINGKKPDALTKTQQRFLMIISSLEKATISDIEKFTGISKSSISITVSRMAEDGYIIRYKGESEDARKSFLTVTKKGEDALEILREKTAEIFDSFYEGLKEEKKKILKAAIENFYSLMHDEGGIESELY